MFIDSMYEPEAIGALLEQKGVMTKEEIIDLAKELKRKTPSAEPCSSFSTNIPSDMQRFTDTDYTVIEEIMEVVLQHGLSVNYATRLLARTIQLLEWGKPSAPDTMH